MLVLVNLLNSSLVVGWRLVCVWFTSSNANPHTNRKEREKLYVIESLAVENLETRVKMKRKRNIILNY